MKNDLPTKGCGGLSDVQICLHAPKANMQTYLYGTAKETEQMLNRFPQIIAPKYLHYKLKIIYLNLIEEFAKSPSRGD